MALKNGRQISAIAAIVVGSVIPAGTIAPFGGGTVPAGWLLCDGSQVSRSTFANLFATLQVVHGSGNGTTTFHLPDYRGRFLRGADNMGTGAATRDPDAATRTAANAGGATGNTVGSVQAGAFASHGHTIQGATRAGAVGDSVIIEAPTGGQKTAAQGGANANGGNETRPQNANTLYIIKT